MTNVKDTPNHLTVTAENITTSFWFDNPHAVVNAPCGDKARILFAHMTFELTEDSLLEFVKLGLQWLTHRPNTYTTCSGALAHLEET